MDHAIEKSVQSLRDIEEAFVYIAEGDLDKAVYFLVAVEETLEVLAVNPLIGSKRRFENKRLSDLRIWRVKGFENYLIVYLTVPKDRIVRLVRLLNVNRDFDMIFE